MEPVTTKILDRVTLSDFKVNGDRMGVNVLVEWADGSSKSFPTAQVQEGWTIELDFTNKDIPDEIEIPEGEIPYG